MSFETFLCMCTVVCMSTHNLDSNGGKFLHRELEGNC